MSGARDAAGGPPTGQPATPARAPKSGGATKPSGGSVRSAVGGLVSEAASKLPFRWVTAAVVGVFLAATALFGGLETARATLPAELRTGEAHASPMASLTVQRAVLIDDFVEGGASVEEGAGERVLVLIVDAENASTEPIATLGTDFGGAVRLEALPDQRLEGAARFDDGTIGPTLQPGVPAQLALSWVVPADAFADGDEVRVSLFDHERRTGSSVLFGDYWALDPELAAVVTVPVEDVGAGADAEGQP